MFERSYVTGIASGLEVCLATNLVHTRLEGVPTTWTRRASRGLARVQRAPDVTRSRDKGDRLMPHQWAAR